MSAHRKMLPFWVIAATAFVLGIGIGIGGDWEAAEQVLAYPLVWVAVACGFHIGVSEARKEKS
jgi:hypothetical protein